MRLLGEALDIFRVNTRLGRSFLGVFIVRTTRKGSFRRRVDTGDRLTRQEPLKYKNITATAFVLYRNKE